MSAPMRIAAVCGIKTPRGSWASFAASVLRLFMHWRGQDSNPAKATLAEFHEKMGKENQRRAFALVNAKEFLALESS